VTTCILYDLIDHELRVSSDVETLNAGFDGDSKATEEGLVLRHIVRGREVHTHDVPHVLPEGRDKEQAHACPGFHYRPIEVEGPTFGLYLQRGQLRVRPLDNEIRKDLGLDCLARRVCERFAHELYRLLCDPTRSVRVADNLPQQE
jgi:hypothetical protein